MPYFGALPSATSAAVAFYHTGVERHLWLSSCGGQIAADNLSADDLFAQLNTAPTVLCDAVAWQMAGLSMASWNGIASLVLVAIWLSSAKK
jgi:disulfide bond formation protein DsbB